MADSKSSSRQSNTLADQWRATGLPHGAALMSLFNASIDRGETPDPAVMQGLAELFRALLAAVSDTGGQRAQRIVKALDLAARRGRKPFLPTVHGMEVALDVAMARRKGVKKPMRTVAAQYGIKYSTVRACYAAHKANAEQLAELDAQVRVIIEGVLRQDAEVAEVRAQLERIAESEKQARRFVEDEAQARAIAERLAESEKQARRFVEFEEQARRFGSMINLDLIKRWLKVGRQK